MIHSQFVRLTGTVVLALASSPVSLAQLVALPQLDTTIAPNMQNIARGDFGEALVKTDLRSRGFEVFDTRLGSQGIDFVAVKRDSTGAIIDTRVGEVKYRTAAGDLGRPGNSKLGLQLSDEKLLADLERTAASHPDPATRAVTRESAALRRSNPGLVKAHRYVINMGDARYKVFEGPTNARPVGRPVADGSLTTVFKRFARSGNAEDAHIARTTLRHLRSLRPIAAGAPAAAVTGPPRIPWGGAGSAAAMGGALTTATVAGVATYEWYQGEISDDRLYEELTRAGGDGIAVGLATGGVLLLIPSAPGWVVFAVGAVAFAVADATFDWAMDRENEHLIARENELIYGDPSVTTAPPGDLDVLRQADPTWDEALRRREELLR